MLYTHNMKAIRIKSVINKLDDNKFYFSPASERERHLLNKFCEEAGKRYITLSAELVGSKKSYDQVKTVFALIDAIFTSQEARHPTEEERHALYMYFLRIYAPRIQVSGQPGITEPKSLSIMTKEEAARFITDLATFLAQQCSLPDYLVTDVSALFEEHSKQVNLLYPDLIDKDCSGKEYSIDEWCKVNSFSHASGSTETLEIAHIISKGSAPQYRDCVWNFLRLTHEEHMFQHQKGWGEFLELFPHLRPRVERARRLASEKRGGV